MIIFTENWLSKWHISEKGHNSDMTKSMGQLFFHEQYVN